MKAFQSGLFFIGEGSLHLLFQQLAQLLALFFGILKIVGHNLTNLLTLIVGKIVRALTADRTDVAARAPVETRELVRAQRDVGPPLPQGSDLVFDFVAAERSRWSPKVPLPSS